jgi:hypothetical protein
MREEEYYIMLVSSCNATYIPTHLFPIVYLFLEKERVILQSSEALRLTAVREYNRSSRFVGMRVGFNFAACLIF